MGEKCPWCGAPFEGEGSAACKGRYACAQRKAFEDGQENGYNKGERQGYQRALEAGPAALRVKADHPDITGTWGLIADLVEAAQEARDGGEVMKAKWRCAIHGYVVSQKPLPGCLECESGVKYAQALDEAEHVRGAGRRLCLILPRVLRQTTAPEDPCQVVRGHCQVHGYDTPCPVAEFAAIVSEKDASR